MNQLLVVATSVLEGFDWIVLGIYFLALVAVAVWVVIQKNNNTEDYFLAGRNVGWFVIGSLNFCVKHRIRTCRWSCRDWI